MSDVFPRRNDTLRMIEAEKKISDAMYAVEALGADLRLSDAITLLDAARASVADWVDDIHNFRRLPNIQPVVK